MVYGLNYNPFSGFSEAQIFVEVLVSNALEQD